MIEDAWEQFEVFADHASAAALVGRLRLEGVPAEIDTSSPLPGLNDAFRVVVPSRLAHRARWVMAAMDASASELDFLATGELRGSDDLA